MQYLFQLSKEDLSLARAECEAANPEATGWEDHNNTLICTTKSINTEHLAFTRITYELIMRGLPARAEEWLKENPRPTHKKVMYFKKLFSGEDLCSEEVYKALHVWLGRPLIDLDHPEETYGVIVDGDQWLVVKKLWENHEDFEARKAHNKPAPHPTGMHPKLARAMINLSRAKEAVLDPFCGAGGILLEARLMGLQATGVDIDPLMIARSKKNLEYFNTEATLIEGDALSYQEKAEVIVTDTPYGRNSKAESLVPLFSSFLKHATIITKKLVIGLPSFTDNESLIKDSPWNISHKFEWRLTNSLKKEIYVLSTE